MPNCDFRLRPDAVRALERAAAHVSQLRVSPEGRSLLRLKASPGGAEEIGSSILKRRSSDKGEIA
jgi:hypothetical protein